MFEGQSVLDPSHGCPAFLLRDDYEYFRHGPSNLDFLGCYARYWTYVLTAARDLFCEKNNPVPFRIINGILLGKIRLLH